MTHYRPRPPSAARSRRGFALIAVLWVITALAALLGVALATTRLGTLTTRNRVLLARDRWAAEACLAIAAARWADHQLADTATIELGRSTRSPPICRHPPARGCSRAILTWPVKSPPRHPSCSCSPTAG